MNKKTVTGLVVVAVVGTILFFVSRGSKVVSNKDKELVLMRLTSDFGQKDYHKPFIDKADAGYIKAWADGIRQGLETFMYNNTTYWVKGGTTKK